jgi:protein-tyrosine phosphatase
MLNIFTKNKAPKFTDFSSLVTDMHSHLIPGIDDGSNDMNESIDLIKKLYHLGFRKLITTPHIISGGYNNTPQIINDGLDRLKKVLLTTGLPVELFAAGEYLLDDNFEEKYKSGNILTVGKKYVLIELPFIHEPESFYKTVFDLQVAGYKVILAHAERYSYWYGNPKKYEDLKDREIYLQLNTVSLAGHYSAPTRKAAEWLIDNEMITFLGTDAHNEKYIESLTQSLSSKYLQKLLSSNKLLNSTL